MFTHLAMECCRRVHISYLVSGGPLGCALYVPGDAGWTSFVTALHYYAARVSGVPVWCVQLLWKENPWDEAQLPKNVYIQCVKCNKIPEIHEDSASDDNRCCNCWEDCQDADLWEQNRSDTLSREDNCEECTPCFLCDLCRVRLLGDRSRCLQCLVERVVGLEDDHAYQARVDDALASLQPAQRIRWRCVQF